MIFKKTNKIINEYLNIFKIFFKKPNLLKRLIYKLNKFLDYLIFIFYRLKYKNLIIRKNTTDIFVFKDVFINKEFNINFDNPKVIIDCGAYIGYSTFYFSKKYPKSKIIAIEPEESNFKILKMNTNRLKNTMLINKAIYHKKAKLKINNKTKEEWAFQVNEDENGFTDSTTIEELMIKFNINKIDILKIDIEGSEEYLFKNSNDWINCVNCIIIELHDRIKNNCSKNFFEAVNKKDFNFSVNGEKIIAIRKNIL